MSIPHINWALEQTGLTGAEKSTLFCLCQSLDADGGWYLKHDTLAKASGNSRRTVIAHIKKFATMFNLTVTATRHADGRQGYNHYRLDISGVQQIHPDENQSADSARQSADDSAPECSSFTPITSHTHPITSQGGATGTPSPVPDDPADLKSDWQKAVYNWNVTAEPLTLPTVKVLNPTRLKKLRARLSEVGLPGWNDALANLEQSEFCRGKNDRGWKADFDFMLKPDKLAKLMEGGYGNTDGRG